MAKFKETQLGMTVDKLCGNPPGSFQKFLKEEEERFIKAEKERRERILAAKKNKK